VFYIFILKANGTLRSTPKCAKNPLAYYFLRRIIMQEYGKVKIDWTPEKTEAVKVKLMSFFNEVACYSGECITQTDRGNIGSVEVMSEIADILFEDIKIEY